MIWCKVDKSWSLLFCRLQGSPLDLPTWFYKVYSAATGVLAEVKNTMAPKGILRFNSDGQMVMICYAVSRQVQQSTGERSLIFLLCCVKCLSLLKVSLFSDLVWSMVIMSLT